MSSPRKLPWWATHQRGGRNDLELDGTPAVHGGLMLETVGILSLQRWAFQSFAMMLTALILPRFRVTSIFGPFLAVVALAFVNAHVWSTALFFQLPDTVTVQAGLLLLVNGVIFWLLVKLLPGIEVSGIFPAILAPVLFTVLSVIVEEFGSEIDWGAVFEQAYRFILEVREYFLTSEATAISGE
ncbi:phage holin family protein [bacterium]|nr:phage holin family protein [bacterium]